MSDIVPVMGHPPPPVDAYKNQQMQDLKQSTPSQHYHYYYYCYYYYYYLNELHVDRINVRPLLTIHLDGHKVAVEHICDLLTLKTLSFHYVAPVDPSTK